MIVGIVAAVLVGATGLALASPASAVPETAVGADDAAKAPLRTWMRGTMKPAQKSSDFSQLAAGFESLSTRAPDGFDGWEDLAKQGMAAAKDEDLRTVRRTCVSCHMKFQRRYREAHRGDPWDPGKPGVEPGKPAKPAKTDKPAKPARTDEPAKP